jgi:hypothetical protein
MPTRQKITFGEMRAASVRAACWSIAPTTGARALRISADRWPDHIRLSDLERLFACQACGRSGADIRPQFDRDTHSKARRATKQ